MEKSGFSDALAMAQQWVHKFAGVFARESNRQTVLTRSATRRHCPFANPEPRVGTTGNSQLVGRYRDVQIPPDNIIT